MPRSGASRITERVTGTLAALAPPGRRASALVVPVENAPPALDRLRARHDPSARQGVPAHVTVLYPFVPAGAIDETLGRGLRDVAAHVEPFPVQLTRAGTFGPLLYLAPEPAAPFVALTRVISARWPEHQPYRGRHAETVPHLTVAQRATPQLRDELDAIVPVDAYARELWLVALDARRRWVVRWRGALGRRAAHEDS
ncbi:MAG TPA: 2'-5' RNA ligase family protein [Acidimicrobiia bacterium]|nr:2'-5' RNA ligase family protein [Acidimicrobiia bacterium]